jgi:hypothetical protein
MYDGIYSKMVKSGIAVELPNEEMVTLDGAITKNEAESYGRNEVLTYEAGLFALC